MSCEAQRNGWHSRGYLPHLKRVGATYFVTFRLADSLPREAREQMAERLRARRQAEDKEVVEARDDAARRAVQREEFVRMEAWLDAGGGSCVLREPEVAALMAGALRHFEGERYRLPSWVVMPNHVHALIEPLGEHVLGDIVGSWKQYVARRVGGLREQAATGPLWQRESFDRWVRDETERARTVAYIERNPVKAGLCAAPEAWRWSSAWRG
ncbi:MAG: transposase [Burkholderiales bacterium]|nr:transposase [Opitutaceae bacterium]